MERQGTPGTSPLSAGGKRLVLTAGLKPVAIGAAVALTAALAAVPAVAIAAEEAPVAMGTDSADEVQKPVAATPYDYDRNNDGVKDSWNISGDSNKEGQVVYAYVEPSGTGYTLHFGGVGAMADFRTPKNDVTGDWDYSTSPWGAYQNPYYRKILSVVFDDGCAITHIGTAALYVEKSLVADVVLPDSVESIGNLAFVQTPIRGIAFPESLKTIGDRAFEGTDLQSIDLSGTSIADWNGAAVFNSCTQLSSVSLPDTLTKVPNQSFYKCAALKSVGLPDAVKEIGREAFNSSGLVSIDLNKVETLGTSVFANCDDLASVAFGNVTSIPYFAFGNSGLTTVSLLKSSTIANQAFAGCTKLTSAEIYDVVAGSTKHFAGCTALKTVTVHGAAVGQYSFQGCTSLSEVSLDATVTKINTYAFGGCDSLSEITLPWATAVDSNAFPVSLHKVVVSSKPDVWPGSTPRINDGKNAKGPEGSTLIGWYGSNGQAAYQNNQDTTTIGNHQYASGSFYAVFSSDLDLNGGALDDGGTATTFYFAPGLGDSETLTIAGKTTALPSTGITRKGYELAGWNTEADGTGTRYNAGDTVQTIGATKLYAEWIKEVDGGYTIEAIPDQTFTGAMITPAVVVKDADGKDLGDDDYTVTYSNNKNVGTAKVEVTIGDKTAELEFAIVKDARPMVAMGDVDVTYNGSYHKMKPSAKTSSGHEIDGAAFTLGYFTDAGCTKETRAPVDAGTYYVKATLQEGDNYSGGAYAVAKLVISKAAANPTITVTPGKLNGAGTVKITVSSVPEGASVNIECSDPSVKVVGTGNNTFETTLPNASKTYGFTATTSATGNYEAGTSATATVEVTRKSTGGNGGGGGTVTPTPSGSAVTLPSATDGGKVSSDRATAKAGETVTLTVTPDEGHRTSKVRVTDEAGRKVKVSYKDGKYTFTMPEGKATASVEFKANDARDFADNRADTWFKSAVEEMSAKGVMNGYGDGTYFGVGHVLTRGEFAALLHNWAQPGLADVDDENETKLADVADGQFYTSAANWAVANGIINGVSNPDGTRSFAPDQPVTLEQMCVIIGNLVDRDAASAADTSELDRYVDGAQVSPWAKNYVAWASKVGLFSGSVEQDGLHVRGGESIMRERVAGVLSNAFKSGILK